MKYTKTSGRATEPYQRRSIRRVLTACHGAHRRRHKRLKLPCAPEKW